MPCGVFRCISVDFGVFRCISVFTLTAGLGLGGGGVWVIFTLAGLNYLTPFHIS